MEFKCSCSGSGVNGFTGKCGRCGMTKVATIEKTRETLLEHNLKLAVLNLPKYTCYSNCQVDCMEEDINGEYIKLKDVLNLFSAK